MWSLIPFKKEQKVLLCFNVFHQNVSQPLLRPRGHHPLHVNSSWLWVTLKQEIRIVHWCRMLKVSLLAAPLMLPWRFIFARHEFINYTKQPSSEWKLLEESLLFLHVLACGIIKKVLNFQPKKEQALYRYQCIWFISHLYRNHRDVWPDNRNHQEIEFLGDFFTQSFFEKQVDFSFNNYEVRVYIKTFWLTLTS